ncbi:hypothetical protein [Asticcacaulis sp. W401b]|uniref:hypothetical protein n=1 Tax=Asticcacaulis sp. W401b TaxID=3388666 RepID=UPI003970B737
MNKFAPTHNANALNFRIKFRQQRLSERLLAANPAKFTGKLPVRLSAVKKRQARLSVVLSNLDKYAPAYRAELQALSEVPVDTQARGTVVLSGPTSFEEFVGLLKK